MSSLGRKNLINKSRWLFGKFQEWWTKSSDSSFLSGSRRCSHLQLRSSPRNDSSRPNQTMIIYILQTMKRVKTPKLIIIIIHQWRERHQPWILLSSSQIRIKTWKPNTDNDLLLQLTNRNLFIQHLWRMKWDLVGTNDWEVVILIASMFSIYNSGTI